MNITSGQHITAPFLQVYKALRNTPEQLTQIEVLDYVDARDETAIEKRAIELFERAFKIWPSY